MSPEQIRKDLEHRHELYKTMLEAYPDPNNKHAIDLIARMREVTSLIKYIDSLGKGMIQKLEYETHRDGNGNVYGAIPSDAEIIAKINEIIDALNQMMEKETRK